MAGSAVGGEGVALARSIARTSRPAGSDAERRARAECADYLRSRGFEVTEQLFEYSTWPGRWGTPYAGVWLAFFAFAAALDLALAPRTRPAGEVVGTAAVFSLVIVLAIWANARWGSQTSRAGRRHGVNLVARRGVPIVWLVAHLDTKGQPVSLVVRALGVILLALGWIVTAVGWITFVLAGPGAIPIMVAGLVAAGLGALPLAGSVVLDRGTGALDNASGVACIFEAIDRLDPDFCVGVVVTTAEELALAGARAWAGTEPPGIALNGDGVDDEGEIMCVVGRDRQGRLARGIDRARRNADCAVHVRRALPGVLFDSVALAEAGWDTMTVTRGTWRSLARVHTAGDTLAAWQGRGVAGAAAFLAAVAGAIVAGQQAVGDGNHPARREE